MLKATIVYILLFHYFSATYAQQPIVSSVGLLRQQSGQLLPILFKSQMSCLDLQTGLSVYYAKRVDGRFNLNCMVDLKEAGIGILFYPVPTEQEGTLKSKVLLPINKLFDVLIYSIEGKIMYTNTYSGSMLFEGVHINTTTLQPGTYVLKVSSGDWQQTCKFIKI